MGFHSQALTLQGDFEFHKGLEVIRYKCCIYTNVVYSTEASKLEIRSGERIYYLLSRSA